MTLMTKKNISNVNYARYDKTGMNKLCQYILYSYPILEVGV